MSDGPTNANRVVYASTGTALAVVIPWLLTTLAGLDMPAEVSHALAGLVVVAVGALWSRYGGV